MGQYEDNMLDMAWKAFQSCQEDKRQMDIKASFVLAADGIILTALASGSTILSLIPTVASALASVISIIFCVGVLWIRKYPNWNLSKAWIELGKAYEDETLLKQTMYSGLADFQDRYGKINTRMAILYNCSVVALLSGVWLLSLALVL